MSNIGSSKIAEMYVGSTKIAEAYVGSTLVFSLSQPQPALPAYTLRLRFTDGYTPTSPFGTLTRVSSSPNVWDWTFNTADWGLGAWQNNVNLLEVIDGNTSGVTNMSSMFYGCTALTAVSLFDTSGVTNMSYMFYQCTALTTVPLFDTSNVTTMSRMFYGCSSLTSVPLFNTSKVTGMLYVFRDCTALTSVPLFNTSKVTNMNYMFQNCTNVVSGALALYRQASSQTKPPKNHTQTFRNCGSNTTTGAAELAQIPSGWK